MCVWCPQSHGSCPTAISIYDRLVEFHDDLDDTTSAPQGRYPVIAATQMLPRRVKTIVETMRVTATWGKVSDHIILRTADRQANEQIPAFSLIIVALNVMVINAPQSS